MLPNCGRGLRFLFNHGIQVAFAIPAITASAVRKPKLPKVLLQPAALRFVKDEDVPEIHWVF
jgi:hypothetical protein